MSALAVATGPADREMDDLDLVAGVRAGDDRAFEVLYLRYQPRIAAYVAGMVRDHGRAEDITQEVFLSALRRLREGDEREILFRPWIYEIAKNKCIDAYRRGRHTTEVSFDARRPGRRRRARPARRARHDARHRRRGQARVRQPARRVRRPLAGRTTTSSCMREFEGLSYREIGERLGMSRPAVESTLFRARKRLGEEYEELVTRQALRARAAHRRGRAARAPRGCATSAASPATSRTASPAAATRTSPASTSTRPPAAVGGRPRRRVPAAAGVPAPALGRRRGGRPVPGPAGRAARWRSGPRMSPARSTPARSRAGRSSPRRRRPSRSRGSAGRRSSIAPRCRRPRRRPRPPRRRPQPAALRGAAARGARRAAARGRSRRTARARCRRRPPPVRGPATAAPSTSRASHAGRRRPGVATGPPRSIRSARSTACRRRRSRR